MNTVLKSKGFWIFMVILAAVLMIIGFFTKDVSMWITALGITLLIRIYAYDLLFGNMRNRLQKLQDKHASEEG